MRMLPVYIAICAIIALPVFAYFLFAKPTLCGTGHTALLRTSKQTLQVSIASTEDQQRKGLGGCKMLARKTGMYFPFSVTGPQTFWMKGMIIPLDMVWLKGGRVVGTTSNIPFPSPDVKDAFLPLYHSPQDVDAVLEIPAGTADSYGLTKGSQVVLVN